MYLHNYMANVLNSDKAGALSDSLCEGARDPLKLFSFATFRFHWLN